MDGGLRRDGREGGGDRHIVIVWGSQKDGHCQDQTEGSELLFPAVRYGPLITMKVVSAPEEFGETCKTW